MHVARVAAVRKQPAGQEVVEEGIAEELEALEAGSRAGEEGAGGVGHGLDEERLLGKRVSQQSLERPQRWRQRRVVGRRAV